MGIFHAFYIVQMLVILCKVSCNFTKIVQNFTISPKKVVQQLFNFWRNSPQLFIFKIVYKKEIYRVSIIIYEITLIFQLSIILFKREVHSDSGNLTFIDKLQFPLILRSFALKVSKNWKSFLRYLCVFPWNMNYVFIHFQNNQKLLL